MKKKLWMLLLMVCFAAALFALTAAAADVVDSGTCGDNLTWAFYDDGTLTIDGTGAMYDYCDNGYSYSDYDPAPWANYFPYCYSESTPPAEPYIKHISIGKGVEVIGAGAFISGYTWTSTRFHIPLTIEFEAGSICRIIKDRAFAYTQVKSIELPETLEALYFDAFYCSELESIVIPERVTYIGWSAFSHCNNLSSVAILGPVTDILRYTFCGKMDVEQFYLPGTVNNIGEDAFDGVNINQLYFDGTQSEWNAIKKDLGNETLASAAKHYNSITNSGVCGNNLTWELDDKGTLTIRGTGEMYDYAAGTAPWMAQRDSIAKVVVKSGVTRIGSYAFAGCAGLTDVALPDSVTSIGAYAFSGTNVDSLFVEGTRYEWSTVRIETGNAPITNAEPWYPAPIALGTCGENVTWSLDCRGTLIISGAGDMDDYSRYGSPGNAPWNGRSSSITSVEIEPGVTSIGKSAFYDCKNLTCAAIADSVTSIGEGAFYRCSSLTSVAIPDGVTKIAGSTFYSCTNLTDVKIPSGVTEIGASAFSGCSSLTSIALPEGISVINYATFSDCGNLSEIVIPDGVVCIGNRAFDNCYRLQSIDMPDSVSSIGDEAFRGCGFRSVIIPNRVSSIGDSAFESCYRLTQVTIPDGVESIARYTFCFCDNLTKVEIPASVTAIGDSAFSNCSKLTDVYYGGSAAQWARVSIGESNEPLQSAVIHFPFSITAQPEDYVGVLNSMARFAVKTSGAGLTYQWQYSDDNGVTWLDSSLTTAAYSAKLTAEKDGRMVRCVVRDPYGDSKISDAAVMRAARITITAQPADYVGAVNSLARVSVTAEGYGLAYQWQYSDDSGKSWLSSSLKTAAYTAKLTAEKDGRMVRCVITDSYGNTATTGAAAMRIYQLSILTQPADCTGAVNSTAVFTVAAKGDGLRYQWQYSDNGGKNWSQSSLKSDVYSAKLTAEKDGRMVRCVVSDQYGNTVISQPAAMHVVSALKITAQPKDYVGAVNSTAKFTVTVSGSGLAYQWQYSDDNGRTWLASSIKSATYSAKFTADKHGRMVRCVVTDAGGSTVTSTAAKMTLSVPVITGQPQNYVGAVNSTARFTVTAAGNGLTYQWQYSDDNGKTWLISSLKTAVYSAKFTADKNGRMVRCVVTDAGGNTVVSSAAAMKLG